MRYLGLAIFAAVGWFRLASAQGPETAPDYTIRTNENIVNQPPAGSGNAADIYTKMLALQKEQQEQLRKQQETRIADEEKKRQAAFAATQAKQLEIQNKVDAASGTYGTGSQAASPGRDGTGASGSFSGSGAQSTSPSRGSSGQSVSDKIKDSLTSAADTALSAAGKVTGVVISSPTKSGNSGVSGLGNMPAGGR